MCAYTASEDTKYHFECNWETLEGLRILREAEWSQAASLCMQTEHGGHTNAYTASEDTNYHFECNWEALEGALDRFAQFFIAPLISEDGVEREVNAVDSECALDQLSGQLSEHDVCRAILPAGRPACPCQIFLSAQVIVT